MSVWDEHLVTLHQKPEKLKKLYSIKASFEELKSLVCLVNNISCGIGTLFKLFFSNFAFDKLPFLNTKYWIIIYICRSQITLFMTCLPFSFLQHRDTPFSRYSVLPGCMHLDKQPTCKESPHNTKTKREKWYRQLLSLFDGSSKLTLWHKLVIYKKI